MGRVVDALHPTLEGRLQSPLSVDNGCASGPVKFVYTSKDVRGHFDFHSLASTGSNFMSTGLDKMDWTKR